MSSANFSEALFHIISQNPVETVILQLFEAGIPFYVSKAPTNCTLRSTDLKCGTYRSYPRHWKTLAELVGISTNTE